MPHNPQLTPKKHAFKILFGQKPLTLFRDYEQAIKVELIKHDDPESMLSGIYQFAKSTWANSPEENKHADSNEMKYALKEMLSGRALQLGLEAINFTFLISGVTRLDTHQIVRQRVGVVFAQQCSGDRLLHHNNCLVEPSIRMSSNLETGSAPYRMFKNTTVQCKMAYAALCDSLNVSLQAARSIMPHNLETFIFMHTNLSTLLFFHQKRVEDGSQTHSLNRISNLMAEEVCKVFPDLKETFERNKTRFKFQREASKDRANTFSTSLYKPKADDFDYHERDFLYPQTKDAMHLVNEYSRGPFPDEYYWGYDQVTKEQYDKIKEIYSQLDEHVANNHFSNEEILKLGQDTTKELECAINR